MNPSYYLKAIIAGLLAGLGSLYTIVQTGKDINGGEWVAALVIALTTSLSTYSAGNKEKPIDAGTVTSGSPVPVITTLPAASVDEAPMEFPSNTVDATTAPVLPDHTEANLADQGTATD